MRRLLSALALFGTSLALSWPGSVLGADAPVGSVGSVKLPLPVKGADHDWPQWRGPNRNGISPDTGLLKKWPEEWAARLVHAQGRRRRPLFARHRRRPSLHPRQARQGRLRPRLRSADPEGTVGHPLCRGIPGRRTGHAHRGRRPHLRHGRKRRHGLRRPRPANSSGRRACPGTSSRRLQMGHYGYSESPLVDGDKVICCPGVNGKRDGRS